MLVSYDFQKTLLIMCITIICYQNVCCQEPTTLSCLTSESRNGDPHFKMRQLTITKESIAKNGTPSCVVYTTYDRQNTIVWYGFMSQNTLPLQCYNSTKMNCIRNMRMKDQPTGSSGILCCCAADECNYNNPVYYAEISKKHAFMFKPMLQFFSMLAVIVILTLLFTFIEVSFPRYMKSQGYNQKIIEVEFNEIEEVKKDVENPTKRLLFSLDATQVDIESESAENQRIRKILEEDDGKGKKSEKPSLKKKKSVIPPKKERSTGVLASQEITAPTRKTENSGEGPKTRRLSRTTSENKTGKEHWRLPTTRPSFLFRMKKSKKKSSTGPLSPDPTQEDEIVNLPPKPANRVLKNRVQGVSMNFENSTFSDLA